MVIKLNSDILAKTFELKEMLMNSDTYMQLKECEKNMLDDKECFILLNAYQLAQGKYNDAKRFEKYGGKVEEAQKELSELKLKVDENQLVKEYNKSYKEMRKELKKIESIIFKDIVKERKEISLE